MRDSRDYSPLAPIQEHFWTASELGAFDGSLTECAALRVAGRLERAALTHAVGNLLARHEVLRSTVVSDRDGPVMRVLPVPEEPPLTWLDLGERPAADREAAMHEALSEFAEAATDLTTGPLVRFLAIRMDRDEFVFALSVHHLVADATAVRIMYSELSRDYEAALRAQPSPVAEPELQYGDYAEWERTVLLPAATKADAAYWRDTLRHLPAELDLRLDRPRPPIKGTRGRRAEFRFADSVGSALHEFARQHRTTPYVASLAAYAALIIRSTGVEDVVLGVLAANRSVPEVENLVGQFANTVPLRITATTDTGFVELTTKCAQVVAEALDHARLPLSRITALVETTRDPSRTPVFQHLFLPAVDAVGDLQFCGLPTEVVQVRRNRGRFDTIVEMAATTSGARAWIEYDTALYTDRGIAALMSDYEHLLATWLADPSLPIAALPLQHPPTSAGPHPDLPGALTLTAGDTVLAAGSSQAATAVRTAAEQAGATVLAADPARPAYEASVALLPNDRFGEYVSNSHARVLIVDDVIAAADLARLRETPGRRALRLVPLPDGTQLVVDITGLPQAWPTVTGGGPGHLKVVMDGPPTSPYTPGTLHIGAATTLLGRWNPDCEIEIVDGLVFTAHEPPATTGTATDDPLLVLMCELWADALQLPEVKPQDDFFVVGGYSMIAARLLTDLSDSLGVPVRMRTLFENPSPELFVAELRRLHPHLDDLLAAVAAAPQGSFDAAAATAGVEADGAAGPSGRDALIPLLAAQRQLWLAEQANPGALTHTIPLLLRIDGPLNPTALRGAVADVVARQAGLRGVFIEVDGEPRQRIEALPGYEVPEVDLRTLPAEQRADRNRALERETAYGGFDLTTGPLLRAQLVRIEDERHVLHLLFHHLVTDEVSMTVFMRELSEFYRARTEDRPARPPELTLSFADLVRAEHQMLSSPEGDRLRRFWARTLAGTPQLDLPTDHQRPDRSTFVGEFLERRAPVELSEAIGRVAREHRTTAFTVFCAAVVAVLNRLTGSTDIVLGVPTENRGKRGAELLIGCFLNVVPVRVDCSGEPTFAALLDRVSASLLSSYEHQRLPFAEIVDAVRPARPPNAHPIYQVTCELQLADWMPVDLPGCQVSYELLSHGTARYDMAFHALMRPDGLSVMLEINTDLWERETGLARIDQTMAVLAQVSRHPGVRLSELHC